MQEWLLRRNEAARQEVTRDWYGTRGRRREGVGSVLLDQIRSRGPQRRAQEEERAATAVQALARGRSARAQAGDARREREAFERQRVLEAWQPVPKRTPFDEAFPETIGLLGKLASFAPPPRGRAAVAAVARSAHAEGSACGSAERRAAAADRVRDALDESRTRHLSPSPSPDHKPRGTIAAASSQGGTMAVTSPSPARSPHKKARSPPLEYPSSARWPHDLPYSAPASVARLPAVRRTPRRVIVAPWSGQIAATPEAALKLARGEHASPGKQQGTAGRLPWTPALDDFLSRLAQAEANDAEAAQTPVA